MRNKDHILQALREEFDRWQRFVGGLNEDQLSRSRLHDDYSIKDELGHLRAWQQLSIARLEAAHHAGEPVLPDWLMGLPPDEEEYLEDHNARIHASYHAMPGVQVRELWQTSFRRFLELAEALPEAEMLDTQKYAWLNGYALYDVLNGSYEHHCEHYEALC